MFVTTSDGSLYARLQQAIGSGNLPLIYATAELGWVPLRDALAILLVIKAKAKSGVALPPCAWQAGSHSRSEISSLPNSRARWSSWPALPDENAQRSSLALAVRGVVRPNLHSTAAAGPVSTGAAAWTHLVGV